MTPSILVGCNQRLGEICCPPPNSLSKSHTLKKEEVNLKFLLLPICQVCWRHFARLCIQTVCGRGRHYVVRESRAAGTRYLVRLTLVDCEMVLK